MATYFKRGSNWYVQYFDHTGRRRTKSTRQGDHAAAERIGRKWEADEALMREQVIDPRQAAFAAHGQESITKHLDDFAAAQRTRSGAEHVADTRKFIEWICETAGFATLRDIEPDAVNRYASSMLEQNKSQRTVASYIQAIKSFTRWTVKTGKLAADPLATVVKPDPDGDRRLVRRFLSHDEYRWLDGATRQAGTAWGMAGTERAALYALAIQTGLRSGELRSLTRGKLHLQAKPPFVMVDAKRTKNSKPARQYIQPELAAELRAHIATKVAGAPVFNMPAREDVAEMLRDDMARARGQWLATVQEGQERIEADASDFLRPMDSEGETLDFHALRHTCASWLIQAGADVKTVQSVMRHSDIKLTLDRYGHLYPGSEAAAVAMVRDAFRPSEPAKATGTAGKALHICGQSGCETVRTDAIPCEPLAAAVALATDPKPNENHGETLVSPEKMQVRVLGLEPRTHGLKVCNDKPPIGFGQTTYDNPPSAALHICGQSGCEPVRDGAKQRPSLELLLELWGRLTSDQQWATIEFLENHPR